MMTKRALLLLLVLMSIGFATPAEPADITINVIAADWTDAMTALGNGVGITFLNTDGLAGNEEIRWGFPLTPGLRSGYRFDGAAPPDFTVPTDTAFTLGDFTHFNFPILNQPPPLLSAQLNLTAELLIDGVPLSGGPFTFSFLHNETPNTSPTPEDPANNDLVSFSNLSTSDTFMVGGEIYTLELLGFRQGAVLTTSFSTVENQANVAELIGIFRATTTAVPEPSTLLLLGAGLAGLLGYGRNRMKQ